MKYIVIFNDQINDIEITGFNIMTEKEVETLENLALSIKWPFIYHLNDYSLEFMDGDDYLNKLEFKEITNEEYKVASKMFNEGFGVFINEEFLEGLVEEEEEDLFEDTEEDDYDSNNDNDEYEDE